MNAPKVDELDYIQFLLAAQRVFTCTEAAACQPEQTDPPAHDAFTRLLSRQRAFNAVLVEHINRNDLVGIEAHHASAQTVAWVRDTVQFALEELRRHDLYDRTSQAFAVFLPVRSVAVMGDGRRYDYVIALRAVETIDFMTAKWSRLPYEFLELVSSRIINEVHGISRVTYDISSKPPATIEWE